MYRDVRIMLTVALPFHYVEVKLYKFNFRYIWTDLAF